MEICKTRNKIIFAFVNASNNKRKYLLWFRLRVPKPNNHENWICGNHIHVIYVELFWISTLHNLSIYSSIYYTIRPWNQTLFSKRYIELWNIKGEKSYCCTPSAKSYTQQNLSAIIQYSSTSFIQFICCTN